MPPRPKLVVCATGDLAIPVLQAVIGAGYEIVRVVSQPTRDVAAGFLPEERQDSALVRWTRANGLAMSRTEHPGGDRMRDELAALAPDLGLVVAYGRRFPTALLGVPRRGWIKVHFSLLPKHRGLHPIRATLWHGDRQAGATVIQVTEEPDAGPILEQEKLDIESGEIFGELMPRVAELGARLVLPGIAKSLRSDKPKTRAQNEKGASRSPRFDKRHLRAPWVRKADQVADHLRALSPQPGMSTLSRGVRVRILRGEPANHIAAPMGEAGLFIGLRSGKLAVLCGGGTVFGIDRLQPEGEEPMSASRFVRSRGLKAGDTLI